MEIDIFTGMASLNIHRRYSSQTPQLEAFLTALPAFPRQVDGKFGIQHGVSTCKPNSGPGSGCIEKDDPFPAIRVCRLNDFKLDSLVFHDSHSSVAARNTSVYPNAYRIDAVIPAAMRLATAANPDGRFGRPDESKSLRESAILLSPTL